MKVVIKCSSVRRLRYLDLSSTERRLLRIGRLIQKMLVNDELLILLRRYIEFDGHQEAATINQTSGHNRLVKRDRLFGHLRCMVFSFDDICSNEV